LAQYH
jgi:thiosulfate reductase cytochrome b subunit